MNELNQANKVLSTLKNVRILYLPPCTVASSQYIGENPESGASKALWHFVQETNLTQKKPDLRVFGFNNPCPQPGKQYGYEFWVTIPEDMEVPEPLQKKQFAGGLYAAHFIQMDNFHEWQQLDEWIKNNTEYEYDRREPLGMGGCLEEHLNAYSHFREDENEANFTQFDLLSPVRKK